MHVGNTTGATSSYTAKEWFTEKPFILATQAKQVFYIQDLVKGREWEIVQECNQRGIWDIPEVDPTTSASIPLTIENCQISTVLIIDTKLLRPSLLMSLKMMKKWMKKMRHAPFLTETMLMSILTLHRVTTMND